MESASSVEKTRGARRDLGSERSRLGIEFVMGIEETRIAIIGCGSAARIHLGRLLALPEVRIVACVDPDRQAAESFAASVPAARGPAIAYSDHVEMLRQANPLAIAIFTPHLMHYRPAMDALQTGCHVFIEKPLSTNTQEAVDIVRLARARNRKVGVGHQYRLRPSLERARSLIAEGAIGRIRLVEATLAQPWLATHAGAENSWRFDPKISGGGILADAGDHLIDALLWTTGQTASRVAALQDRPEAKLDVVTAATIQLDQGTLAILSVSGVSPESLFELVYFGDRGRIIATDHSLSIHTEEEGRELPAALPEATETIDSNFIAAISADHPLCCPADEAVDTVRLLEAIHQSVATSQVVQVS